MLEIVVGTAGLLLLIAGVGVATIGVNEDLADRFLLPHADRQRRWGLNRTAYLHLNYLQFVVGCAGVGMAVSGVLWVVLALSG